MSNLDFLIQQKYCFKSHYSKTLKQQFIAIQKSEFVSKIQCLVCVKDSMSSLCQRFNVQFVSKIQCLVCVKDSMSSLCQRCNVQFVSKIQFLVCVKNLMSSLCQRFNVQFVSKIQCLVCVKDSMSSLCQRFNVYANFQYFLKYIPLKVVPYLDTGSLLGDQDNLISKIQLCIFIYVSIC